MRKIYISEAQLRQLSKMIAENGEMTVAYKAPANGTPSTTDMQNQLRDAQRKAPNTKVNLQVGSEDLNLSESEDYEGNDLNYENLKYQMEDAIERLRAQGMPVSWRNAAEECGYHMDTFNGEDLEMLKDVYDDVMCEMGEMCESYWAPLTKKQINEKRLELQKAKCKVFTKKSLMEHRI